MQDGEIVEDVRIQTGIKNFDDLISGGLIKGSVTLVSGMPGTGKSIFCMQVLYYNASKGKKCLYVTFEQSENDVKLQLKKFGLDYGKLDGNLKIVTMDSNDSNILEELGRAINEEKYDLIVIDSLASLVGAPVPGEDVSKYSFDKIINKVLPIPMEEENVTRIKVKIIIDYVRKSNATALLTSEISKDSEWLSRDTISEFLCDSVIAMYYLGVGSAHLRSMQIMKMRLSDHEKDFVNFEIGKEGIGIKKDETFKV